MAKKKKHTRKKIKEKNSGPSVNPAMLKSLLQIFFWASAGLILVSFSRQGRILIRVNDFLTSFLGWTSIFLPFIMISFGFAVSKFKILLGRANVIVGSLLFFFSLTTLTHSGSFGSQAGDGVAALITPAGSILLLLALCVAGLLILFNVSFEQLVEFATQKEPEKKASKKALKEDILIAQDEVKEKRGFLGTRLFAKPESHELKILGGQGTYAAEAKGKPQKALESHAGEDGVWKYPPVELLSDSSGGKADRGDLKGNAAIIEETLDSFGITARVIEINQGPAVTQYAIEVALGTKLSKITALDRDLARSLESPTGAIRIEAPIAGRSLVGIELPNKSPEFVPLKKMLLSDTMRMSASKLTVALGLDVAGQAVVADIGKMPHVLIAGQTGSGKSVCLNTFLASLLFRTSPSQLRLILVDPKRVEMTGYNGIPHLLTPVIVEPDKVLSALRWLVGEMDRRYKLFAQAGVRNIDGYNEMSGFQAMPYIVLVIDELADIMLFAPVEVEDCITRLAQMSRATGIHMVLATQRPSVDVLTGLIKANVPHRIAFAVSSQVDSRVILDAYGAEKLLGKGDMLHLSPEQARPKRIQGAFVSDKDVNKLVEFLKAEGVNPEYTDEVINTQKAGVISVPGVEAADDMFKKAVEIVCQYDRASASLLQRKLSVGYARAARILDQLEEAGVVGASEGSKPREVLVKNAAQVFGGETEESSTDQPGA